VYISQFNIIIYDNIVANHISLLDRLGEPQAYWPVHRARPVLIWALPKRLSNGLKRSVGPHVANP
jgi:hypothetical protein